MSLVRFGSDNLADRQGFPVAIVSARVERLMSEGIRIGGGSRGLSTNRQFSDACPASTFPDCTDLRDAEPAWRAVRPMATASNVQIGAT